MSMVRSSSVRPLMPTKSHLRIVHLCDPQFGFSSSRPLMTHRAWAHLEKNYVADVARTVQAIDIVNEMNPDLVLFGGDMAQRAEDIVKEWPRLLKRLKVPWMITPGNHDMGNAVVMENLRRFRDVFGRDREAREVNGWRIIAGNSQFWHPTKDATEEQTKYNEWVAAELERAKSYAGRVIIASHIPPFAFAYDEKDSYDNHPSSGRIERLESCLAAGVRFYLSAHQHRMVTRGYKDMTILTGEALCANFDLRPPGFRLFEVGDDFNYSWNFIGV